MTTDVDALAQTWAAENYWPMDEREIAVEAFKAGWEANRLIIEEDGPLRLREGELRDLRERYPAEDAE